MATPDPSVAIAGSPKPGKDDSDKPMDAPDPRILQILRAGPSRHPCRRGNCMTLQAPRRRRGRQVVTKLMNRDAIIKAYFKNRGGQHSDIGRPRQPPPIEQNQANWTYDPGLCHTAKKTSRKRRTRTPRQTRRRNQTTTGHQPPHRKAHGLGTCRTTGNYEETQVPTLFISKPRTQTLK